jgi:pimeloyl-ACP methyl ester carboxylesterase
MERAVVVGHSMGGLLAQELSRRHPDRFAGLALVSITDEAWDTLPAKGSARAV